MLTTQEPLIAFGEPVATFLGSQELAASRLVRRVVGGEELLRGAEGRAGVAPKPELAIRRLSELGDDLAACSLLGAAAEIVRVARLLVPAGRASEGIEASQLGGETVARSLLSAGVVDQPVGEAGHWVDREAGWQCIAGTCSTVGGTGSRRAPRCRAA